MILLYRTTAPLAVLALSQFTMAAPKSRPMMSIECNDPGYQDSRVTLTPTSDGSFLISVDKGLSVDEVGAIPSEDLRVVSPDLELTQGSKAVLTHADGQSRIEVSLPLAAIKNLKSMRGKEFNANIKVGYKESQDTRNRSERSTDLSCRIINGLSK